MALLFAVVRLAEHSTTALMASEASSAEGEGRATCEAQSGRHALVGDGQHVRSLGVQGHSCAACQLLCHGSALQGLQDAVDQGHDGVDGVAGAGHGGQQLPHGRVQHPLKGEQAHQPQHVHVGMQLLVGPQLLLGRPEGPGALVGGVRQHVADGHRVGEGDAPQRQPRRERFPARAFPVTNSSALPPAVNHL